MTNNFKTFTEVLQGSKCYEFNGTILTLTGYYSGRQIKLDLSLLDEETLEKLIVDEDEDDYYE